MNDYQFSSVAVIGISINEKDIPKKNIIKGFWKIDLPKNINIFNDEFITVIGFMVDGGFSDNFKKEPKKENYNYNFCQIPIDLKKRLKNLLEPQKLWNEKKYGLYSILHLYGERKVVFNQRSF
jgi:hypothetical protein